MTAEDTQRIADLVLQLWNTGNLEIANEVYADNAQRKDPNREPARGPQQIAKFVAEIRTAFPDFKLEVKQRVAEGDHVVSQWTATGTQKGDFLAIPPTGKRIEIDGMTLAQVKDGKIADERVYFDRLGMLEQLGVAPNMHAAAAS